MVSGWGFSLIICVLLINGLSAGGRPLWTPDALARVTVSGFMTICYRPVRAFPGNEKFKLSGALSGITILRR
jgi:hypothetical protein